MQTIEETLFANRKKKKKKCSKQLTKHPFNVKKLGEHEECMRRSEYLKVKYGVHSRA
jgi:hypothetical protein